MKLLMEAAIAAMKKDGVDFSALDGYRQRYRHFGYEKCGSVMEYFFTGNSFIHMACEQPKAEITLRRVGSEEREWVEEAYAMFNEQLTHCLRTPEAFSDTVRSWTVTPYVVESNGKMAGYFVEKDGQIGELVLRDEDLVVPVLRTFYEMAGKMSLTLRVYPHETERMDRLLACCETVSVKEEGNYRIFNFESVLRFAMNVAAESKTLADGSLTVEIIGYGTVVVRVENGSPSAERTEAVADCRLTPEEAARFFFSPVLIGEARRLEAAGGVNWLPLPLSINHQDKC